MITLALQGIFINLFFNCPWLRKYIRNAEARTSTSFLPPASQTVTHSLQPSTRILSKNFDFLDDLFNGFFLCYYHKATSY
jgi:hypothetical protein